MTTPVCTVDALGIHKPTYAECHDYFRTSYRGIYGQDIYIDPDSQDGQLLALLALALDDVNGECVSAYNAFSPSTAQGNGLSRVVKINGIARKVPSASTALLTIGGVAGTVIENGIVSDINGVQWLLPSPVTIPIEGQTLVTATCSTIGAVSAAANTINDILTPVLGWQTANNEQAADIGQPTEIDGQLRVRQSISTMVASRSIFEGTIGAVAEISGVTRFRGYENDTLFMDDVGVPANSIAIVIDGGNAQTVVNTIGVTKPPGIPTFGTTVGTYTDQYGIPHRIFYSPVVDVPVTWQANITKLTGYTSDIATSIKQELSDWTNALGIGNSVDRAQGYMAAQLYGAPSSKMFRLTSLKIARDGNTLAEQNIGMAYNEAPLCDPEFIDVITN